MELKISPSLICMDFLHVEDQIKVMNRYADYLHLDIMDGRFVNNAGLCPAFIKSICSVAALPLDCHIMAWDIEWWIDRLADVRAERVCFHPEAAASRVEDCIQSIRARGMQPGLALSPKADIKDLIPFLPEIQFVTVMTVTPGCPGQSFIWESVDKLSALARYRAEHGLGFSIMADGSVSDDNIKALTEAGTDCIVAGNAMLFDRDSDLNVAFTELYRLIGRTDRTIRNIK